MKTLKKAPQILIGIIPVMLLWLISCIFQDDIFVTTLFSNILKNEEIVLSAIIPAVTFFCMIIFLFLCTILCKRFNLKYMYYSALLGVAIPAISIVISNFFPSSGTTLSYLFGLTIGLILYPFGRLANFSFEGLEHFYWVYFDKYIYHDSFAINITVIAVISILLFILIRKKKQLTTDN